MYRCIRRISTLDRRPIGLQGGNSVRVNLSTCPSDTCTLANRKSVCEWVSLLSVCLSVCVARGPPLQGEKKSRGTVGIFFAWPLVQCIFLRVICVLFVSILLIFIIIIIISSIAHIIYIYTYHIDSYLCIYIYIFIFIYRNLYCVRMYRLCTMTVNLTLVKLTEAWY